MVGSPTNLAPSGCCQTYVDPFGAWCRLVPRFEGDTKKGPLLLTNQRSLLPFCARFRLVSTLTMSRCLQIGHPHVSVEQELFLPDSALLLECVYRLMSNSFQPSFFSKSPPFSFEFPGKKDSRKEWKWKVPLECGHPNF